jgi:hypothetical protein
LQTVGCNDPKTIRIVIYNVHKPRDPSIPVLYCARMLTSPGEIDHTYISIFRSFLDKKKNHIPLNDDESNWWFGPVWASLTWWAALTGSLKVRIKIMNGDVNVYGGLKWFPFQTSKIIFNRRTYYEFDKYEVIIIFLIFITIFICITFLLYIYSLPTISARRRVCRFKAN